MNEAQLQSEEWCIYGQPISQLYNINITLINIYIYLKKNKTRLTSGEMK